MKQIVFFLLILSISTSVSQAQASSKRKAAKEVTPIVVDNVKYTAPTDQIGYIVARDAATDILIWQRQIYTIHYNKNLERDVQDVFIDSLYIKGKNLMVHTERGKVYSLKLK